MVEETSVKISFYRFQCRSKPGALQDFLSLHSGWFISLQFPLISQADVTWFYFTAPRFAILAKKKPDRPVTDQWQHRTKMERLFQIKTRQLIKMALTIFWSFSEFRN